MYPRGQASFVEPEYHSCLLMSLAEAVAEDGCSPAAVVLTVPIAVCSWPVAMWDFDGAPPGHDAEKP